MKGLRRFRMNRCLVQRGRIQNLRRSLSPRNGRLPAEVRLLQERRLRSIDQFRRGRRVKSVMQQGGVLRKTETTKKKSTPKEQKRNMHLLSTSVDIAVSRTRTARRAKGGFYLRAQLRQTVFPHQLDSSWLLSVRLWQKERNALLPCSSFNFI